LEAESLKALAGLAGTASVSRPPPPVVTGSISHRDLALDAAQRLVINYCKNQENSPSHRLDLMISMTRPLQSPASAGLRPTGSAATSRDRFSNADKNRGGFDTLWGAHQDIEVKL
jgi:hypothetical protein